MGIPSASGDSSEAANASQTPSTTHGLVGLALSGGGIRSSCLSLGVIQALVARKILPRVDYLSTVSGGGLVGSSVSAVLEDSEATTGDERFPLAFRPGKLEGPALRHLRRYSNYLEPGGILDTIRLPAVILRGIINNLVLLLPLILIAVQVTEIASAFIHPFIGIAAIIVPVVLAGGFVVAILGENVLYKLSPKVFDWEFRNRYERLLAVSLLAFLVVIVMIVPSLLLTEFAIDDDISHLVRADFWTNIWLWAAAIGGLTLLAFAGQISGAFGKLRNKILVWLVGPFSYALVFGLYLVLILYQVDSPILDPEVVDAADFAGSVDGLADAEIRQAFLDKGVELGADAAVTPAPRFLPIAAELLPDSMLGLIASEAWNVTDGTLSVRVELHDTRLRISSFLPALLYDGPGEFFFLGSGILGLLYAFGFSNQNFTSARGYFRDRISRAFVFVPKRKEGREVVVPDDDLKLSKLNGPPTVAPYHLINTTLNMQDEPDRTRVQRNAGFFVLTRYWIGGPDTGYCRTEEVERFDRNLNLATAATISGAGLSPNMGVDTVRSLVFILTLLNLRLDYWLPNPEFVRRSSRMGRLRLLGSVGPIYLLKEALGMLNASGAYVNLSDGGHIENLAVYELLRRRSKWIIGVDGAEDPEGKFECLMQLMQFAIVDMGIRIQIDIEALRPGANGYSQRGWAVARIDYGAGEPGYFIYLKSSLTEGCPVNLREFRSTHPAFPQTPSSDQFFSEAEFEAYRELGWAIANDMLASDDEVIRQMVAELEVKPAPGAGEAARGASV